MMAIDREKYMDLREVRVLRESAEAAAVLGAKKGRIRGVLGWIVVDLATSTGLRVAELARLKVGDVDLKRKSLRVWRLKRRKPGRETLAIDPELAAHLSEFIEWKAAVGEPVGPRAILLRGKRGPLTTRGLQRIWHQCRARAGLPAELSIHSARHTVAVHQLRKTSNLRIVQKQLGHASPATTANMYADVSFEDMQTAVTGLYED